MIMSQALESPDIMVGDISNSPYKIETSAKMISILSSKIYTDKIMAPIRELLCNAWDAHVAAGNQSKEIDVSLPSSPDYKFSIRDYGTGLSESDMRELYTTYGASTKTKSNDFTGCMGLGSKAPFAYTNEFTVTSFFQGRRYSFLCALNNGMASITQFPSVESDEPSGLLVEFEVVPDDRSAFYNAFSKFYYTFNGTVRATRDGEVLDIQKKDLADSAGYGVIFNGSWDGNITVIMSGVAYPYSFPSDIPKCLLASGVTVSEYTSVKSSARSGTFFIIAAPGDIDFAASREACENTDKTNSFVFSKLSAFFSGVLATELSAIEADATLSALRKASKIVDIFDRNTFLPRAERDKLLEFFNFNCPTSPTDASGLSKQYSVVGVCESRWGGDNKREKRAAHGLSVNLSANIPYSGRHYNSSKSELIKAVANQSIRFVKLPEDRSRSVTPPAVNRLLDHCSLVFMIYEDSIVKFLESLGISVCQLSDLPKPERTVTRSKADAGSSEGRTDIQKALAKCKLVTRTTDLSPAEIWRNVVDGHSGSSVLLREGSAASDSDFLEDKLNDGKLVVFVFDKDSKQANNRQSTIVSRDQLRKFAHIFYKKLPQHNVVVPVHLLVSLLNVAGYAGVAVCEDKAKVIQQLIDAGARYADEVFADLFTEATLFTKSFVDNVIRSAYIRSLQDCHLDMDTLPLGSFDPAVARVLRRSISIANDPEFNIDNDNVSQYTLWLSILKYYKMPTGTNYYSSFIDSDVVVLHPESYIKPTDDFSKHAISTWKVANETLLERYPAIAAMSYSNGCWGTAVRRAGSGSKSFDVKVYLEAMDLYYKKHAKDNKKEEKGEEND